MRFKYKKWAGLLFLSLISLTGISQDIHFSQYYMSPLMQNPSLAGAKYGIQSTINYKDQWRQVGAPYKTFAMSYDMQLKKKRSADGYLAFGINMFHDKAGDSKMGTSNGGFNLAYHVKLDNHNKLGGGLQAGFFQRTADFSNLQWGNQYDGMAYNSSLPSGESMGYNAFTAFDMGAGIVWTYDNTDGDIYVTDNHDMNFDFGISVFHLNRPKYSYIGTSERLPMKFVAHGSGVISIPESEWGFVPGFMYYRQGPAQEIYAGMLMRYLLSQDSKFTGFKNGSAIYIGAYYRARDAIAAKLIFEYAGWAFGVSYDINTSSLKQASNTRGGLELSIRFVSPNPFGPNYGANHSRY